MRLRILTLLAIACLTAAGVRMLDISYHKEEIKEVWNAGGFLAEAEAEDETEKAEDDKNNEEGTEEAPADPNSAEGMIEGNSRISRDKPQTAEPLYTESELNLLQRLSERRKKLEEWERDIRLRENVLNLSQAKLQEKIDELKKLKMEVESKLSDYNEEVDEKTQSLVKIYESMKPKKAAAVFAEMSMDVLIKVVENMKEKSVAPIMDAMDPIDAKRLTEEFAARGKLNFLQNGSN